MLGHFVILWTDAFLYFIFVSAGLFIYRMRRHARLRDAWQHVLRNSLAIISAAILTSYIAVALLDSVHFQSPLQTESANLESVFDYLLKPIGQQDEETYSAPFASHLYNKEVVIDVHGNKYQDYPKLHYAGLGLADCDAHSMAVIKNCIIISGVILAIAVGLILLWRYKKLSTSLFTFIATLLVISLIASNAINLAHEYHIFGTDKIGQDVFYQTLKSIRTGLIIGTLTTLIILPFAILLGMLAGYFRGWLDDVVQYIYTTLNSIPDVLLIAAAILALQLYLLTHPAAFPYLQQRADLRLLALCLILGTTSWTNLCRLLRGETLKLREQDYVLAARALGTPNFIILIKHILPNLMHLIVIAVVMDFSGLVLAEAVLTYIGVGVDPTTFSWGNIINEARQELAREPLVWWPLLSAFVFMFPLVISANLLADAVRDALDPRVRNN